MICLLSPPLSHPTFRCSACPPFRCHAVTPSPTPGSSTTGPNVAFETDSGGTVLWQYTWGSGVDDLLGVRDSTSGTVVQYSVVQDQLGSV